MIIECQRLFDGTTIVEARRIIIEDDRIVAVEPLVGPVSAPYHAHEEVIACRFAMPGLIDSHVHVYGYQEGPPVYKPFEPHEDFMRLLLYAGVTTVRDMGNALESLHYLRQWSEREQGVRLFSAGPPLDCEPLSLRFARLIQHEADAEQAVERLAFEGVHFIKAYCNVPPALLEAIIRTARRHHLKTAVAPKATTAREACLAGAWSLEHLIQLIEPSWTPRVDWPTANDIAGLFRLWALVDLQSDAVGEFIELLKRHAVAVCPALLAARRQVLLDEAINEPYLDYMVAVMPYHRYLKGMRNPFSYTIGKRYLMRYLPYPQLDKMAQREVEHGWEKMLGFLLLLHQHGVNLVAGVDSPNPSVVPGFSLHHEMRLWVQAGIPAVDVLAAATSQAANMLGVETAGAIRPGAWADLLLLESDPSTDIRALSAPQNQVICRGRRVDRPKLKTAIMAKLEQE